MHRRAGLTADIRLRRGVSGAAAAAAAASTVLARGLSRIGLASYAANCERRRPPNMLLRAPEGMGPRMALMRAPRGAMLAGCGRVSACGPRPPPPANMLLRALIGAGLTAPDRLSACETCLPAIVLARKLARPALAGVAGFSADGRRSRPAELPRALRGACLSV